MPIGTPEGFLDITNATLRTSVVGISNTGPTGELSVGSNLHVNTTASNVLQVVGNVSAHNMTLGEIRMIPAHGLENVTEVGNTTPFTVSFSNATTGLATTSNLHVGGTLKVGTVEFENPLSLAAVSLVSNTTPYTIEFSNAATGLATTANVDVGGELTVSGNATVSSNLTVGEELTVSGNATVSSNLTVGGTSLVDLIYPLGAIYITTSAVSPSSIWAGTTWVAYGEGRTMIGHGAGAGLTDRPTVEATGGAETHTLTKAEIPPHKHSEVRHNDHRTTSVTLSGLNIYDATGYQTVDTGDGSADGLQGQAHNNMQPYIVTYMWKRTA